jgi:hypothetical protein
VGGGSGLSGGSVGAGGDAGAADAAGADAAAEAGSTPMLSHRPRLGWGAGGGSSRLRFAVSLLRGSEAAAPDARSLGRGLGARFSVPRPPTAGVFRRCRRAEPRHMGISVTTGIVIGAAAGRPAKGPAARGGRGRRKAFATETFDVPSLAVSSEEWVPRPGPCISRDDGRRSIFMSEMRCRKVKPWQ